MSLADLPFTLPALRAAITAGTSRGAIVAEAFRRIAAAGDPGIFLHLAEPEAAIAEAEAAAGPLAGIPFAVKDNIDVAGMPTTAACPAFATTPERDAAVVALLRAAGAVPIGKTNLDQFATGLVGTRTPYPVPLNPLDPSLVPGGSSSGSAVAVARGLVPFALGTDTAGSGRVPAALNAIVGLKPTLGALSTTGVVPACRTLDTVSVFALTVADAHEVFRLSAAYDAADPWSRTVAAPPPSAPPHHGIGVPAALDAGPEEAAAFRKAVAALEAAGARIVPFDFAPFAAVAALLYEGAWVAERLVATEALLAREPDAIHPVTRQVIERGRRVSAADAFRDRYRLEELRRAVEPTLSAVDLLLVPTVPMLPTLAAVAADPIGVNARLGTYTNFVNLLDLCGIAVPVAPRADGPPGSVTLLARRGRDGLVAAVAQRLEIADGPRRLGATPWRAEPPPAAVTAAGDDEIEIAVCGAPQSGLDLNRELMDRGARFLREARTTEDYRLYSLPGGPSERPGLVRAAGGAAIAVEVWAMPLAAVGGLLATISAPLGFGTVYLADGSAPKGVLYEADAVDGAEDVTRYGSWRAVLARAGS